MPLRVDITPELQETLNKFELLGRGIFPATSRAVDIAAGFVMRTWVNIAQGNDLSGKPQDVTFRGSIDYANSIRIVSMSPFHKVVTSDSEVGARLHEGSEEYDMKPALVRGPKSRVSKDGKRYNIVPFRHKVAKMLKARIDNQSVYDMAKRLTKQKVIGFKIDNEGKRRMAYAKWTRDKKLDVSDRMLAGMVRMETSTGRGRSSLYLTFRTVTLDQVGKWIRAAQSAWDIVGEVNKKTRDKVEKLISGGMKEDLGI